MASNPQDSSKRRDRTRAEIAGEPTPRMPHERDESADTAQQAPAAPTPQMRRGYADASSGRVDTDKGPVLDRSYHKLREEEPRAKRGGGRS
ncbi:hypothetical protein [Roseateles violae]|uniref:Uncharacterized protein n=1 Tax=Roseateles violae TaxID=3058042 RepID=A0ABT8DUD9_9BURK|nr:hypothetical protein [Pelomonas sp. PFR6]MDN3920668.1 hypothetical protein [Pelomonas sp. PFR6]